MRAALAARIRAALPAGIRAALPAGIMASGPAFLVFFGGVISLAATFFGLAGVEFFEPFFTVLLKLDLVVMDFFDVLFFIIFLVDVHGGLLAVRNVNAFIKLHCLAQYRQIARRALRILNALTGGIRDLVCQRQKLGVSECARLRLGVIGGLLIKGPLRQIDLDWRLLPDFVVETAVPCLNSVQLLADLVLRLLAL